jgi:hypothetical protein
MSPSGEQKSRPLSRFVVSIALAGLLTALLWRAVPDRLSVSTDIVGYDIFNAYDIYRYSYGYYFFALLFPFLSIAIYLVLAWKGPLRYRGARRAPVLPIVTASDDRRTGMTTDGDPAAPGRSDAALPIAMEESRSGPPEAEMEDEAPSTGVLRYFWSGARVLLPAGAVGLAWSAIRTHGHVTPYWDDVAAGLCYVAAAVVLATVVRRWQAGGRPHVRRSPQLDGWWPCLALVNGLLAIGVVPLLFLVSASTHVAIGKHLVYYRWLPWWLAASATVLGVVLVLHSARRASSADAIRSIEANVLTWLVGPVLLYLSFASLPGALGYFDGFDDGQYLAAPQLIIHHGLFPWRDIYLLHGLLGDFFDGQIGLDLFGNTRWGATAGFTLIVYPLNWLALYAFAAYFARGNRLLLVGAGVAITCGLLQGDVARFLLIPILLIALDRVVRSATWARCWLFVAVLAVAVILTPEEVLFIPCFAGVVVLVELVGYRRGNGVVSSFTRTIRCAIAGASIALVWIIILLATRSLTAFIDYFRVFSSGHILEGGYPTQWNLRQQLMVTFEWVVPTILWLLTLWRVVAKVRLRRVWSPFDWVLLAAASSSAVYFPKALDRADAGHVMESFAIAVPLLVLWAIELLGVADRSITSAVERWGGWLRVPRFRHIATIGAVAAVILGTFATPVSASYALRRTAVDFEAALSPSDVSSLPRLGYTTPGTVDTAQISALGTILHRYAGRTAPVFDFSNEPGIVYYLLDRVPGTRYYYSAVSQTLLAQDQEIDELRQSRPPLVIFSNTTFGLLSYDGIPQSVRSFAVSQYLFANYRPLLDVRGQLILLRNDLVSTAPPVPPGLVTTDLYFDTPACQFGDIPNFFALPAGTATAPAVHLPAVETSTFDTTVTGWAVDAGSKKPAAEVFAVADGHLVATAVPTLTRPDVASVLHDEAAISSGFTMTVPTSDATPIQLFALDRNGMVTPLNPAASVDPAFVGIGTSTTVPGPDGRPHRVLRAGLTGSVDSATRAHESVLRLSLPAGTSPSAFQWLTLRAPSTIGDSSFVLSDGPTSPYSHTVQFNTLPVAGKQVTVEVGSCLQWHGYGTGATLYLSRTASGPAPPVSVSLIK